MRVRPPEGMGGSTRYTLRLSTAELRLWGFGICYLEPQRGAIYVNRYCFVPRWVPDGMDLDAVWQDSQMSGLHRPATQRQIRGSRRLLQSLLRWIAGYERWVENTCGASYRGATLAAWTRTAIPAARMAIEWDLLARHVEEPPP